MADFTRKSAAATASIDADAPAPAPAPAPAANAVNAHATTTTSSNEDEPSTISSDTDSLSIYERMVLAEQRHEAARLGIRMHELEESLALQTALADHGRYGSADETTRDLTTQSSTAITTTEEADAEVDDDTELELELELPMAALTLSDTDDVGGNPSITRIVSSSVGDRSNSSSSSSRDGHSKRRMGMGPSCRENDTLVWSRLPVELTVQVHSFLGDIDLCGTFPLLCRGSAVVGISVGTVRSVSSGAEKCRVGGLFQVSEAVFKHYCQTFFAALYPHQYRCSNSNSGGRGSDSSSGVKAALPRLTLNKFPSWRHMAILRPRLRLNGFYSIRTVYSRAPCNDNFWEPKKTKSVEVEFYRHMRFFEGGDMLYSLNTKDPWDHPFGKSMQPIPKKVFVGKYKCKGRNVTVTVDTHYCTVIFELVVLDGCDSYSQYAGKHSVLQIIKHSTLYGKKGEVRSESDLQLPVNCDMRYWKHAGLVYNGFPTGAGAEGGRNT